MRAMLRLLCSLAFRIAKLEIGRRMAVQIRNTLRRCQTCRRTWIGSNRHHRLHGRKHVGVANRNCLLHIARRHRHAINHTIQENILAGCTRHNCFCSRRISMLPDRRPRAARTMALVHGYCRRICCNCSKYIQMAFACTMVTKTYRKTEL